MDEACKTPREMECPALRRLAYRRAVSTYGEELQMIVAIEELSELQKEICKLLRGKGDRNHLLEEVADVKVVIEQIEMMFDLDPAVNIVMCEKVERLIRDMDKQEGKLNGKQEDGEC